MKVVQFLETAAHYINFGLISEKHDSLILNHSCDWFIVNIRHIFFFNLQATLVMF